MDDDEAWMDDAVAPFRLLVDALAATSDAFVAPPFEPDGPAEGMYVDTMAVALPFELDIRVTADGAIRLAGTAPTQYTRTSVMPVFHRLSFRVIGVRADG
jgi:hypothetical protein